MTMQSITHFTGDYRIAWRDPMTRQVGRGEFMFFSPEDATQSKKQLLSSFPMEEIWLEDKSGQRIEIPDN